MQKLNRRYGNFIQKIASDKQTNIDEISQIDDQIRTLKEEIESNKMSIKDAETRNRHIYDSLPRDGVEKYLLLQSVYYVRDIQSELSIKISDLEKQKTILNHANLAIEKEIRECVAELRIINPIMEEKRLAETSQPDVSPKL